MLAAMSDKAQAAKMRVDLRRWSAKRLKGSRRTRHAIAKCWRDLRSPASVTHGVRRLRR